MATVTIEEAQAHLPELIDHLQAGEELVITRDAQPVAKLVATAATIPQARQPGWYIELSTRYPLNPGLWMTRPLGSETVSRKDFIGPGVSGVRSLIGAPQFE